VIIPGKENPCAGKTLGALSEADGEHKITTLRSKAGTFSLDEGLMGW
jgi:hypothetical protein